MDDVSFLIAMWVILILIIPLTLLMYRFLKLKPEELRQIKDEVIRLNDELKEAMDSGDEQRI